MHRFEIWAPFAKRLSVSVNGVAHRMNGPNAMAGGNWMSRTQLRAQITVSL